MAVQEGLGDLGGIGLDEAAVAVGQVQDEAVGLLLHPADDHQGLAKVALGVARQVGKRYEHPPCLAAVLPDVVLDDGVPAVKDILVPETLEDVLGGMPLLLGDTVIIVQDVVDYAGESLLLSLSKGGVPRRNLPPVTRRHGIGQHLAHRVLVQTEYPGCFPDSHPLHHHRRVNPQNTSTLYIRRTIRRVGYDPYGWRRVVQFATAVCQITRPYSPLYFRPLQRSAPEGKERGLSCDCYILFCLLKAVSPIGFQPERHARPVKRLSF